MGGQFLAAQIVEYRRITDQFLQTLTDSSPTLVFPVGRLPDLGLQDETITTATVAPIDR